ncbi:hypothetical protein L3Q82_012040, partial [Scortum barcoo]
TQPASEELLPSLQQCDIKEEQTPVLEETKIQEHLQVKEEQVDQCISAGMEADESNDDELKHPKSEPAADCELFPSSSAVSLNEHIDYRWSEGDGSSSPHQSHSVEVVLELEEPPREEKSCRFCGKTFKKDSFLIRHVEKSHKGHKAFKCLDCNKEFEQRYQLVLHTRIHTGEKPFRCDYCDKTFVQNSSRLAHMRVHTGEKPYFCAKCGKSFATSNHFKFCKMQNECKITAEKDNADGNHKEEKAFKCFQCNKEFNQKHQLVLHARVHSGEKPFSCDFCGKTFTQNSNRIVHMRQHTGEKPYLCKKCGKRFASSHHLKLCTGTQNKGMDKLFRCTTCGRTFHTDSDLKVHMEVHKAWKRHISEKLQGQEQLLSGSRSPAAASTLSGISRCSVMAGTQRLRLLLNERLAAAAEEICGLVERTIAEYEDEAVRSEREIQRLRRQLDQLTVLNPQVLLFRADTQPASEELLPSLQQCDIKEEQTPVLEETKIQEHLQVKEEQVDQCISAGMEADESNDAEFRHPKSEPAADCELFPSSSAVSLNEHIDDRWSEGDGSSSPRQSHSVEVFLELEEPPREENLQKSCRFCGKTFKKDSYLTRHVEKCHKMNKAFKCLDCNKEFEQRYQLVLHTRIHTDTQSASEEVLPSQQPDQLPVVEEAKSA